MITVLLLVLVLGETGELVLRNGKTLAYRDSYEVKDGHVLFHNPKGDLFKLPLSMVDLDKTEARAEARKKAAQAQPEAEPKQELTPFERFARDAQQTEDGKGGNVIILEQGAGPLPGTSTSSPSTDEGSEEKKDDGKKKESQDNCKRLRTRISILEREATSLRRQKQTAESRATDIAKENALEKKLTDVENRLKSLREQLKNCK
ncbi:MAG: hypothetical protein QNK37_34140 [Acidobacteriota bacterium]|nr:hypothetical protein [Acidobacteriota bacterium]